MTLFLVVCCQFFMFTKICESAGVNENNPFDFRMFENFGLTKEVFIKEQQMVRELKNLKGQLEEELKMLQSAMREFRTRPAISNDNSKSTTSVVSLEPKSGKGSKEDLLDPIGSLALLKRSAISLPRVKASLREKKDKKKEMTDALNSTTTDFPNHVDFGGAMRALVLLQDTYQYDLAKSAEGIIDYVTSDKFRKIFPGKEVLFPYDFLVMADYAFSTGYYTNAMDLIKVANQTMNQSGQKFEPNTLKVMKELQRQIVNYNNQYITKKHTVMGTTFKVRPYTIDNNFEKKKKQPKVVINKELNVDFQSELVSEHYFRKLCGSGPPLFSKPNPLETPTKCGFLHHSDPYLRLGPFKVEVINRSPYMSVLHELLTEKEIQWMIDYSIPRLSRTREYGTDNSEIMAKHEFKSGNKVKIVHKTVQCWIKDIDFDLFEDEDVRKMESKEVWSTNRNYTVINPIMFKLTKKIELATGFNVSDAYSSTPYQTTNYGLGGLCERHMDPHGYIEGREIPKSREGLKLSGDMFATTMGWLGDVDGGGGTAFTSNTVEKVIMPTRGSVALWYNLDKKGHRDLRASHGGCPILKGSKWILNKWIYYFNQFNKFPCSTDPLEILSPPQGYYKNLAA